MNARERAAGRTLVLAILGLDQLRCAVKQHGVGRQDRHQLSQDRVEARRVRRTRREQQSHSVIRSEVVDVGAEVAGSSTRLTDELIESRGRNLGLEQQSCKVPRRTLGNDEKEVERKIYSFEE